MAVVFQLCVIASVGLIAYWWANQGFFSSLLHFVAVVCAGTIAFALWEPLAHGLFLTWAGFDNYSVGLALILLFIAPLLLIRLAFDKLAPGNVQLPPWANTIFGGLFGAGSGILTVGIAMIGIGFTQSANRLLEMQVWTREGKEITTVHDSEHQWFWLPAPMLTAKFFEFLSAGSMYPEFVGQPMALVNPDLDRQAFSLVRDGFKEGTARITMPPDGIENLKVARASSRIYVTFTANKKSQDRAEQFICSSSQIRLLSYSHPTEPRGHVNVAHPDAWKQLVQGATAAEGFSEKRFLFDNISHYMTSIPGQSVATFVVEFPVGNEEMAEVAPGFTPQFIQIKGTRFRLPPPTPEEGQGVNVDAGSGGGSPVTGGAPIVDDESIVQALHIRPIATSINSLVGLTHENRYLVEGEGVFARGARGGSRETGIIGVYATSGTQIVSVHVGRDRDCSMYPAREQEPSGAPVLVDANGREYFAKGYLHESTENLYIKLTPGNPINSVSQLPYLPTSNSDRLRLFYEVTEGVTIVAFKIGEITVARTNLTVQFR
jgi:hypothetical protein